MFEKIKFNKVSNNSFLVNEFNKLKETIYIKKSTYAYKKQNDYLKKYVLRDKKSNKCILLKKDIVKDFNNYKNLTYLKTKELERVCKCNNLEPMFITITLPSKYHPFKKTAGKYILNENFEFVAIEQRITLGYKELNKIFREFYLNVKNNKKNKQLKFIKIIEPHKSLIPHLHRIVYINKGTLESFKNQFETIIKKYELKQTKIEELTEAKGSSYIIKYLLKNFKKVELEKLDGWKKYHKIRLFTMSNLDLSTELFKKLYYSNKDLNLQLLKDIKSGISKYANFYQFYTQNTLIKKVYMDENNNILKVKLNTNETAKRFKITKIIQIKNVYRLERKIEKLKTKIYKSFEALRDIYYSNRFEQFKKFYNIKAMEKENYLVKGKLFLIDIFRELPKSITKKYYKTFDFEIFDKLRNKPILNKNRFVFENMRS